MDKAGVPILYLLCGKVAAGKSTLAPRLAARPAILLISEDHRTSNLFHGELKTKDYGLFGAASRCDGTAPCQYFTARPFGCAGFPGKHGQQSQLGALVDYSG